MKKIFVCFAIEDKFARDNLIFQAKQNHTPFEFVDMSVQQPWDSQWKIRCRERIKQCDGVIAFLSDNTSRADGAKWEIKCAIEEKIPLRAIYVHNEGARSIPPELGAKPIYQWTWPNISNFINSL